IEEALAGARDIVAERVSEQADVRHLVREHFTRKGVLVSEGVNDEAKKSKFEQYCEFEQPVADIPSHRFLAIRRGEQEGFLRKKIRVQVEELVAQMQAMLPINPTSPFAEQKALAIEDGFKRLLAPSVEVDVAVELKMNADRSAVEVFAKNLRNLLLAAPFGGKAVIGIDPGLRTGCKCVALDATGKFLENTTLYLTQGDAAKKSAMMDLGRLIQKYQPKAIAVGNGTAGRETEAFVRDLLKLAKISTIAVVAVNEAGASVYSASEIAREEFPDLDLTIRGAISIGRRLQDPLAELVKVDPKSIGVGQYQHDVYQQLLKDKLDEVVESCVNHVGVELNTASAPLLARVAGIGESLAKKMVEYRNAHGPFPDRQAIQKVPGLGPRTFLQAAGFLRIRGGLHPLDASAVHPERYSLVEKMAGDLGEKNLANLIGKPETVKKIDIKKYISEDVGEPTLRDILEELNKPGRDPRESFEVVGFREDVQEMSDLKNGMELKGIVTNVTAFGAFVDIGVHQDGLVHISQLSDRFINDPSEVVQAGDRITVWVVDVDINRKRIALSAVKEKALQDAGAKPGAQRQGGSGPERRPPRTAPRTPQRPSFSANPFSGL
ncbi:MAG: helix-hairpin-helix domain-containing protein, partial [Kiritimatiellae bacterium]|nr:helix-hairpin-helix domain-containing protein [Kiritimatiellia bacterium]